MQCADLKAGDDLPSLRSKAVAGRQACAQLASIRNLRRACVLTSVRLFVFSMLRA